METLAVKRTVDEFDCDLLFSLHTRSSSNIEHALLDEERGSDCWISAATIL